MSFDGYQREYIALKTALTKRLDEDIPQLRGEERRAACRRVQDELEEADEILDQMELEAKGKAKMMVQVRAFRGEVKGWRGKVASLSSVSDRDLLLSSAPSHSAYGAPITEDDDADYHTGAQRQRLLNSTATLNQSGGRLDNASRLAAENEEIGQGVLSSLVGQRMQLQNTNDQLEEADVSVTRARGTITRMIRTAYRQKLLLWVFTLVMTAMIAFILYRKLR
ncbi:hypothetical protein JCM10207_007110 [Rhodosporidiobolus poonsookiae]